MRKGFFIISIILILSVLSGCVYPEQVTDSTFHFVGTVESVLNISGTFYEKPYIKIIFTDKSKFVFQYEPGLYEKLRGYIGKTIEMNVESGVIRNTRIIF